MISNLVHVRLNQEKKNQIICPNKIELRNGGSSMDAHTKVVIIIVLNIEGS